MIADHASGRHGIRAGSRPPGRLAFFCMRAVFAARFSYMGLYWYDQIIKEMQESGRWKLIATETFFKYDKLEEVSIGRFSKTPSKVFVF